jgi:hypothetical protein
MIITALQTSLTIHLTLIIVENYFMKIQVYLKFEYLNSPLFLFIILCPTLKSYEYFLYFISIYQALILNKILSIHVLVVPVASPQALVVARTRVALTHLALSHRRIRNY